MTLCVTSSNLAYLCKFHYLCVDSVKGFDSVIITLKGFSEQVLMFYHLKTRRCVNFVHV